MSADNLVRPCTPAAAGGVFWHTDGSGCFAAAATDGVIFMRAITSIADAGALPLNGNTRGVIVSTEAIRHIRQLGREGIVISTDGRLISARTADAIFTSKLIDGVFPDFTRVIPPPPLESIEIDAAALDAALARLAAASASDSRVVGLSWREGDVAVHLDRFLRVGIQADGTLHNPNSYPEEREVRQQQRVWLIAKRLADKQQTGHEGIATCAAKGSAIRRQSRAHWLRVLAGRAPPDQLNKGG
jgi:hypothetical protein